MAGKAKDTGVVDAGATTIAGTAVASSGRVAKITGVRSRKAKKEAFLETPETVGGGKEAQSRAVRIKDPRGIRGVKNSVGEDLGLKRTWDNCQYPTELSFSMLYGMYARNSVAARVIETYPDYCWQTDPVVRDSRGPNSRFSKNVLGVLKRNYKLMDGVSQPLLTSMKQLDVLGGIGGESLLVFGFADGRPLDKPVKSSADMKVSWIKVLHNGQFEVSKRNENPESEDFGDVELYETTSFRTDELNFAEHIAPNIKIHASRCVHFKEGSNLSFGISRIQRCYNQLLDITKVSGSSAEVYYLGAFSGMAVEVDPEASISEETFELMEEQIVDYFYGLNRSMIFEGSKSKLLYPAIVSPKDHFDLQITMISIATGIPRRFLTGAEAAKLASQQDSLNWTDRVNIRRTSFVTPRIVLPVVERLIGAGVITKPIGDFEVVWPRAESATTAERSNSARNMTDALVKYFSSGMYSVVEFPTFLMYICGYSETEAAVINDMSQVDNAHKVVENTGVGGDGDGDDDDGKSNEGNE